MLYTIVISIYINIQYNISNIIITSIKLYNILYSISNNIMYYIYYTYNYIVACMNYYINIIIGKKIKLLYQYSNN